MLHVAARILLLGAAITATTGAQVTVRAITRTGLEVWAWAGTPQNVPPSTDITNGVSITSSFPGGSTSASATTSFALLRSDRAIDVVGPAGLHASNGVELQCR